jgi:hypothetical protein
VILGLSSDGCSAKLQELRLILGLEDEVFARRLQHVVAMLDLNTQSLQQRFEYVVKSLGGGWVHPGSPVSAPPWPPHWQCRFGLSRHAGPTAALSRSLQHIRLPVMPAQCGAFFWLKNAGVWRAAEVAGEEKVRLRLLSRLNILRRTEQGLREAEELLTGCMGSRQHALAMLGRCLQLYITGGKLGRHFQALRELVGEGSACSLAYSNPGLLCADYGRPAMLGRLHFWGERLGLPAPQLLDWHGKLLHSRLDTVGPRWAWATQHLPREEVAKLAWCMIERDAECMRKLRVPWDAADYAAFKAGWLSSEEGRAACRHESQGRRRWPGGQAGVSLEEQGGGGS